MLLQAITFHCCSWRKNEITFDRFIMEAFWRHFAWLGGLTVSDSISHVFSSKTQKCVTPGLKAHAHKQPPQSLRSEDYTEKSSDKFKWPEEISIHLGPVSSNPAVRESGRERSKGLTPDMTDALEMRARQLILCVWVCAYVCSFFTVSLLKKSQPVKWVDRSILF